MIKIKDNSTGATIIYDNSGESYITQKKGKK